MKILLSLVIGAVMGILVPWYCASKPGQIMGGVLDGQTLYFTAGGESYPLHWSWLVFGACFVLGLIALAAAEQKY